ncbi:hypothetical protein [Burkholderia cepacia]|nr:hypothetical protein [Burkholderia cepacia]
MREIKVYATIQYKDDESSFEFDSEIVREELQDAANRLRGEVIDLEIK